MRDCLQKTEGANARLQSQNFPHLPNTTLTILPPSGTSRSVLHFLAGSPLRKLACAAMDTFREHLVNAAKRREACPVTGGFRCDSYIRRAHEKWTHQFCKAIIASLPRELRDMVYGEIVGGKHTILVAWDAYLAPTLKATGIEDLLSSSAIHEKFCSELAEAMYTACTFQIRHPRYIETFMKSGTYGVHSQPCKSYLRRLHINIDGSMANSKQVEGIEKLRLFSANQHVLVELQFNLDLARTKSMLKQLGSLFYDLMGQNKVFKVIWRSSAGLNHAARICDITWLLSNTLQQYLDMVANVNGYIDLEKPSE
ncbi:uncharacterized protein CC84DRAFT_1180794 [Paraphaeosphaeria sporulosa]|uniref:Uncharacterized protein n=1 Tax=Paraphaeosphaeria sporulosa TaxID=1460663 RepID=A0A177BXB7_9PLEO|nr:uncharacterized protein CC84DRAFT_1180794 [Paraphaeosphaeria sporulosa]OAF99954.1 hypothetical protein CC84DRAFT_1180794 [Paraphaeosphaeria sporulosa]